MGKLVQPFSIRGNVFQSGSVETQIGSFDLINFINGGNFGTGGFNDDPFTSGSIGLIRANILEATSGSGTRGELEFVVSNNVLQTTGSSILRLFHTGSNNEPRVGIGFERDESISKTFEIKTKKDNSTGTELVLEGSRETTQLQIGDELGKILFVADSSSFTGGKFVGGDIAEIKSIVTDVNTEGVGGKLIFAVGKDTNTSPLDVFSIGYQNLTGGGELPSSVNMGLLFTGSIQIRDLNSNTESGYSLLDNDDNPTFVVKNKNNTQGIAQMWLSGSITASSAQFVDVPAGSESTYLTIDSSGNLKTNTAGASGTSGTSGANGADGANGTSGTSGTSGANGADGANGSSGTSGTSGANGADGANGTSGTSGTSGANGADGANGTSGTSVSISSPSNNSVLTSDGTVNGVVAEANLIFDGTSTLDVQGTGAKLQLNSTDSVTNNSGNITLGNNSNQASIRSSAKVQIGAGINLINGDLSTGTGTITGSFIGGDTGSFSYLKGNSPLVIENPDGITFRSSVLHDVNNVRIVEVTQASDLPTSLAAETTYIIRGDITIPNGSEITTSTNNAVIGLDRNKDCITYTGNGTLFTVDSQNFTLSNLKLRASGSTGKILHANDLNPGLAVNNYGRLKILNIEQCEFRNCYNFMRVEGFELVDLSNTLFWYSSGNTGLQFQAVRHLELSSCEIYNWYEENPGAAPANYSTARMIEFLPTTGSGNVGFGVVNIGTNIIHPEQTQFGLYVDTTSTTSFGTIAANTFIDMGITTGANLGGSNYDSGSMLNYDVGINQGIANSTAELFVTTTGNTNATTFGRSGGTSQAQLGGGTERNAQRISWNSSNQETTYDGNKDIKVLINIALSGEKSGGGSNTYTFGLKKDTGSGYPSNFIAGSTTTITTSGGIITVSKAIITDLANADQLAIFIEATGGDSFTVEELQWTIIEI